jgi:hypothetical protein
MQNSSWPSTIVYTYPTAGRAPSAAVGPDFTTIYVAWLTGWDTFHLAGYRIGAGSVQGTLFSRTMPGEFVWPTAMSSSGTQGLPSTWSIL